MTHDLAPPDVSLRTLDPPLERRVVAVVRAGSQERPAIGAFLEALNTSCAPRRRG
jgi:DNA-binding transcriptional LysR family regulator